MKTIVKFNTAVLLGLITISCTKKNTPEPVVNSSPVMAVYNAANHAAQYPTTGMAFDASGNLYMSDAGSNTIRTINPAGVVTVIAGSGSAGFADGAGANASFDLPSSIAIDNSGNIYVADAANNRIRKVTSLGVATTIAGSGTIGSADGAGKAASFNFPQGIAVDNSGNIYVADTGNDLIRKITADGTVSTLAGKIAAGSANGTGAEATFNIPQGLAVDVQGNLYVADAGNNLIRKITAAGVVSTFAGSGIAVSFDGVGTKASFDFPNALAMGMNGNLYVTEAYSNNASKIAPDGTATMIDVGYFPPLSATGYSVISPTPRPVGSALYPAVKLPNGIAVNSSYTILISDYGNNLLREGKEN